MTNAVNIALATPTLSTLVSLLKAAGLVDTVKGLKNATIFAPTNAAFAKLTPAQTAHLLKPENKAILKNILLTHVVPAEAHSQDLQDQEELRAVSGTLLDIHLQDHGMGPSVFVSTGVSAARVIQADIQADNQVVIHVINNVLLPFD